MRPDAAINRPRRHVVRVRVRAGAGPDGVTVAGTDETFGVGVAKMSAGHYRVSLPPHPSSAVLVLWVAGDPLHWAVKPVEKSRVARWVERQSDRIVDVRLVRVEVTEVEGAKLPTVVERGPVDLDFELVAVWDD